MRVYLKFLMGLSLIAGALLSCSREDAQPSVRDGYISIDITASGEDNVTKTVISPAEAGRRSVEWVKGDRIQVWYAGGRTVSEAVESGKVTTFSIEVPAGTTDLWAVYPYDADATFASGEIKLSIPGVQTGEFAKANISVTRTVTGASDCRFYNATSYVKFTVTDPDITKITVESVGGEPLTGNLPVSFETDNTIRTGTPESVSPSLDILVDGVGDYYAAILPGVSYESGLRVSFFIDGKGKSDLGRGVYATSAPVAVQRSQIASFGALDQKVGNIFVTVSGAGRRDGSSWADAYGNAELLSCLTVNTDAESVRSKCKALEGNTFRLGAGSYDLGYSPNVDFSLNGELCNIRFVGGYQSNGSSTSDPASNETVITGASDHPCIVLKSNVSAMFSGITFSGAVVWRSNEAAFQVRSGASAQVSGCIFKDNRISEGLDVTSSAVYVDESSSLELSSCTFTDNTGVRGCALLTEGELLAEDCTFSHNSATVSAAAVSVSGSARFEGCSFSGNEVQQDEGKRGGAVVVDGGTVSFSNCVFDGNSAYQGGAVALAGSADLSFDECAFYRNHGLWKYDEEANSFGGAVDVTGAGVLKMNRCSFDGNYATRGGALSSQDGQAKIFLNACVFARNYIINGHGTQIYVGVSELLALNNCCFVEGSYSTLGSGNADWIGLEAVGTFLMANSSLIGSPMKSALDTSGSNGLVRLGYVGATEYFINNIMALPNTNSNTSVNARSNLHTVYMYGNKCSKLTEGGSRFVYDYGNCTDYLQNAGCFSELKLASDDAYLWNKTYWAWNGMLGSATDTNKMKADDVRRLMQEVSPEFCTWLSSGCGGALDKDQLGNVRSGSEYWPGSYQN